MEFYKPIINYNLFDFYKIYYLLDKVGQVNEPVSLYGKN